MSRYYLIAQLPSLDASSDSAPLPITEERFMELCKSFLDKKSFSVIENLSLTPKIEGESSGFALIDAFLEGERLLRLALAKQRAAKQNRDYDIGDAKISDTLYSLARAAVQIENPLEAEEFLNRYRLSFLETLRPMDNFSESSVFYYAIKLKLLWRIRQFDTALGQSAYKKIYDCIISSEIQEA